MANKVHKENQMAGKMVRAIANGKNVDAYKLLEQIVKQKVADKIDDAMSDAK